MLINPYLFVVPAPPIVTGSDDFWNNVGALLHFEGANGSTTFTDATGKTWTRQGTVTAIGTGQAKFGSSALYMGSTAFGNTGSLSGITTPTHVDFQAGRGDFTIEWQSYFLNYNTYQTVWSYGSTTSGGLLCQTGNGDGKMNIYAGSGTTFIAETSAASLNAWHEYKLQRIGTTLNLYRDGTIVATSGSATFDVRNLANVLSIGAEVSGQYNMAGYVDEFRFTKGVGRDYEAQTAPYPASQTPNLSTLNPLDIGPTVILTSKNRGLLTATNSSSYAMARSRVSKASGKFYYETKLLNAGASPYALIGVATSAASLSNYPGADVNGWGYYQDTGQTYHNSSPTSFGPNFTANDVIGCAVDMDAGKIWWSKNGAFQGSGDPATGANPAYTGLTGPIFAALGLTFGDTAHLLASFDGLDLTYAPPANFAPWSGGALLNFDGDDTSTTIIDSHRASLWSASGGAQLSTAQSKFGSSSLFVNGGVVGTTNMGVPLGAEFCVQGWAYNTGGTPRGLFHTLTNSTASGLALGWGGSSGVWELYHNGSGLACGGSVPVGWFHWAVYRLAGVIYVAIGGHILNSVADTSNLGGYVTMNIGSYYNNSTNWVGYIGPVSIEPSRAIYGASDFTPPTLPFV